LIHILKRFSITIEEIAIKEEKKMNNNNKKNAKRMKRRFSITYLRNPFCMPEKNNKNEYN